MVEGIIPEEWEPPSFEAINQSQFINMILDRATEEQQLKRLAQKRKYMVAAFRNLKRELLSRIQEKYDMDFKLFDYDRKPEDIYS